MVKLGERAGDVFHVYSHCKTDFRGAIVELRSALLAA